MKHPIHRHKKTIERSATEEVATRDAASFVGALLNMLPNPDPILRKTGKRLETYRTLTGDWEVFSAIEHVHGGLQDLEWGLEQGDAEQTAFEEFEERFSDWDIQKIMSEAVDARNFGYQPFELLWSRGDQWTIDGVVGKPPEWFNFNPENQLQFKSKSNWMGEPVQPYQFAVAAHRESYYNPYGEAVLSRCFWPVAFKKGGIEFMTKFLEKYGIPWAIGKQPRGQSEKSKDKLLDDLENMIQDAVAVIPDDSSVEIMESSGKGSSSDAFMKYIYYFDSAVNKVILGSETAMSVSKEGSDVRGSGHEHAEASKSVINAIGGMAEKVINQAIAWEWHFNHEGPPPVFSIYDPTQMNKDRAERDDKLKDQGVRFTKEYYMTHYGLNEDEFELTEPSPQGNPPFKEGKSPFEGGSFGRAERKKQGDVRHGTGCRCRACQSHFRDAEASRNQRVIDEMEELYGGDPAAAENQAIMETVLAPVIDLVRTAGSYEEIMEQLAEQFPDMSTGKLEERLMKAMFLADTWGRLTAQDEEDEDDG